VPSNRIVVALGPVGERLLADRPAEADTPVAYIACSLWPIATGGAVIV
jgi:hypothetical protein